MNAKAAKLLRKFGAGEKIPRIIKKDWNSQSHVEKGKITASLRGLNNANRMG